MNEQEFKEIFAVFILSHKRSENVKTARMLKDQGYTGDWFIVIDDEDDEADNYRKKYGDKIIQFCKKDEAALTDTGDIEDDRRCGVFARNKIQKIAREMGYKVHLQLDDDFSCIDFRYPLGEKLQCKKCGNLDQLFMSMAEFLLETSITNLSLSLSSYYLGGIKSKNYRDGLIPKTMGSFMLKASDPIEFKMRMNDDITSTAWSWSVGKMSFSVTEIQVQTPPTQHEKGGMTDIYQDNGTYRKSFYSVMMCPGFMKIAQQGIKNFRIHHETSWEACCPCILSEKWKKSTTS